MNGKILVLATLLLLTACGGEPASESENASEKPPSWGATIAFEAGQKLGGCAVGDIDPTLPGNEILAVASTGEIFLVHHDDNGWHGEVIATASGEMIGCAIGDADPSRPGLEAVVGGMAAGAEESGGKGAAHLLYREGDDWKLEPIIQDDALVHGVCIGDVDPVHEGQEVVTVGFSLKAHVLGRDAGAWKTLASVPLSSPGKNAVVFEGKAAEEGRGFVAVACAGGALDTIGYEDGTWDNESAPCGAIGPARIDGHGEHLLLACDDGSLNLMEVDGNEVIHKEGKKLRGAVLADLDPTVAGAEAATAGYEKTVTLLYPPTGDEKAWRAVTLWRDTEKLHHLAAGELLADGLGLELVAVGYSGRVIVAALRR